MNFQAIEQANGSKIMILGTFVEIGGVQFTPQQKAKAICKIRDMAGVSHNVHIYQGTGELPQPADLNRRYQFSLSSFRGNYQGKPYIGYSGFWNPEPQGSDPQQPPQGPPEAPQSTNAPKDVPNDVWEAKDLRMARMNALNRAVELYLAAQKPFGEGSILDIADILVAYIYKSDTESGKTGLANVNPSPAMGDIPSF